jgi:hypothetical protein
MVARLSVSLNSNLCWCSTEVTVLQTQYLPDETFHAEEVGRRNDEIEEQEGFCAPNARAVKQNFISGSSSSLHHRGRGQTVFRFGSGVLRKNLQLPERALAGFLCRRSTMELRRDHHHISVPTAKDWEMELPKRGGSLKRTSEGRKDRDTPKTTSKSRSNPDDKRDKVKRGPSREKVEISGEKRSGHSRPKGDNGAKDEKRGPSREKVDISSKAHTPKDDKRDREKRESSREKVDLSSKAGQDEKRGHSRDKIETASKKPGHKDEHSATKHRSSDRLGPDSAHDAAHSRPPTSPRTSSRSKSRPKSERIPSSPVTFLSEPITSPKKVSSKARPKSERLSPEQVKSEADVPKLAAAKPRRGTMAGDRANLPEGRKEQRGKDDRKDRREGEQKISSRPSPTASQPDQARPAGRRAPSLADQRQW